MLTVRIQAIDGTGTCTLPDFQPCRLLRFPAPRSSAVDSQHRECLQLPVGETQFRSQQRRPLFDLVERVPGEATCGPTAAAQHPEPVALHDPIYLLQRPDVSGNAVIGIVAAYGSVDLADLVSDP